MFEFHWQLLNNDHKKENEIWLELMNENRVFVEKSNSGQQSGEYGMLLLLYWFCADEKYIMLNWPFFIPTFLGGKCAVYVLVGGIIINIYC